MDTTIVGALPKLPDPYEAPNNVRRAITAFESGRVSPIDRERAARATQARAIAWQEEAGLTLLGDGQIRWDDLLSPLSLDIAGMEPGGLLRFFQNNTYYRHPIITGRLWLEGRTLPGWFKEAKAEAHQPIKAALPGPFTVAALSENRQYKDFASLVGDLADVIGLIAAKLTAAGAVVIELEEPALVREPDAARRALGFAAVRRVAEMAGGPVRLALYFGEAAPLLDQLADLGLAGISFDLVEGPDTWDALAVSGFPGTVGLGLLNARDLRLERAKELWPRLDATLKRIPAERILLHPNTSLEYLPPDGARRKLRLLSELARISAHGEKEVRA